MDGDDGSYRELLANKAEKLEELRKRKPGQKGYKRRLRAFLDADAAVQDALLAHIDHLIGESSAAVEATQGQSKRPSAQSRQIASPPVSS
jgi:hypothetical protein